jgi:long-chain acyl-CoA synthetase
MSSENLVGPDSISPPVNNLWENFLLGVGKKPDGMFLGKRSGDDFSWTKYSDVRDRALSIGAALIKMGAIPEEKIGICGQNCQEWIETDLACFACNFVSVPIYDTFDDDAIYHIFEQTRVEFLFCTKDFADRLAKFERRSYVRNVVLFDALFDDELESTYPDVQTLLYSDIVKEPPRKDERNEQDEYYAQRSSVVTICYTSGTTGLPKGVVLTHENILSELAALVKRGQNGTLFTPTSEDVHLSYLPLAHIFERVMISFMARSGARVGFHSGDIRTGLMDDIQALKPTIFIGVPRIFNRIYDGIYSQVEKKNRIEKCMFDAAVKSKLNGLEKKNMKHTLWDSLVFKKIRSKLGGKVRVIVTGSAPISDKTLKFLRIAFNAEVYEGYGQTETSAALTVTLADDYNLGNVGTTLECCQIRLEDVPDMNYRFQDKPFARGEIQVKGLQVFSGYYLDDEKTRESFTKDGWYKTGDIGMFDGQGKLHIIDRVKCIFKLSQGEYVAPEKVELSLHGCPAVEQIFITGNSEKTFCVAIVQPTKEWKTAGAGKLVKELEKFGKEKGLKGFEIPKKIHLVDEFPSHLYTPTMKLKRNVARKEYEKEIHSLYQ